MWHGRAARGVGTEATEGGWRVERSASLALNGSSVKRCLALQVCRPMPEILPSGSPGTPEPSREVLERVAAVFRTVPVTLALRKATSFSFWQLSGTRKMLHSAWT